MGHNHIGFCFACNAPVCQKEPITYEPVKPYYNPPIIIERPLIKPVIDLNLFRKIGDKCICVSGYNMFCPKHGTSK